MQADKNAREKVRHTNTRPAHDLAAFTGDYEHPAYGIMSIKELGRALHWSRRGMLATMAHRKCQTACCRTRWPSPSLAEAVMNAVNKLTRQQANYFFAVVTACRAAELPDDAPLALFAIGRTVGWIAHVIERYDVPKLARARARYVGVLPT